MSDRYVARGRWEDRYVWDTQDKQGLWTVACANELNRQAERIKELEVIIDELSKYKRAAIQELVRKERTGR